MPDVAGADTWNSNAELWDAKMGEGNDFFRYLVAPATRDLAAFTLHEVVLDIACGNGHFARAIAREVKEVVAFDFSERLIAIAREKTKREGISNVSFDVLDATNERDWAKIPASSFDVVTCNMALMDISDLHLLSRAVARVLKPKGKFVFSVCHPCFHQPRMCFSQEVEEHNGKILETNSIRVFDYCSELKTQVLAFPQQVLPHAYYHRSLATLLTPFFQANLTIDGMAEPTFPEPVKNIDAFLWQRVKKIPPVFVCRMKKIS